MLKELKKQVFKANLDLVKYNLVIFTWGNVSGIDRKNGLVVIKPSGVDYSNMKSSDMVVVDLDGNHVEGDLKPSSDTATHLELYKKYSQLGGIVHTHSTYATAFSQAGREIIAYGTTHADYFYGNIPCTRSLTKEEIESEYEKNTGRVIMETFKEKQINPTKVPSMLVKNHAPFSFGKNPDHAVYNAVVLEEVAKMAMFTEQINKKVDSVDQYLLDKHYLRKHGKNAYYGQKK